MGAAQIGVTMKGWVCILVGAGLLYGVQKFTGKLVPR